jgi:hypothetical protein
VFLTSFLPDARKKLRIDVDDIRAPKPERHLRAGQRPGSPRPGRREAGIRRNRVLGARRSVGTAHRRRRPPALLMQHPAKLGRPLASRL